MGKIVAKIFLSTSLALMPIFVLAQSADFSVKVSPDSISAGEKAFIVLSSSQFNIDLAKIVWKVDGKTVDSGTGNKNLSITMPVSGKSVTISVQVSPQNAPITSQDIILTPSDVDLIWEALDSYTPPFYRGKALPLSQAQVKVAAIPNAKTSSGQNIPASSFTYSWRKDSSNFPGQGGFGNSGFIFGNNILETTNQIDVVASNGSRTLRSSIVLAYFKPEIIFYEEDQVGGVKYGQALVENSSINQRRLAVVAEPYFLSKDFLTNGNITAVWKLNGQEVKPNSKNKLVINTGAASGRVGVNFDYKDTKKLFRDFSATVNVNVMQ